MKNTDRTPEANEKAQLENEILRLKKRIEKYEVIELKQNRFGLVWLDVPEAFEDDVENKLPILEEMSKLAMNSKDSKPAHLLIEGDNYHALTCLNYTHKGKVDVIYIDPPYNTGSDGFKYKDKRFLKEYPDGTEVPIDHPLRHSYWLSFMKKRLELSKDLLDKNGIIFISIDDNEHAQLKMLCDEIFTDTNFVGTITWEKRTKAQNTETAREMLQSKTEYILVYKNSPNKIKFKLEITGEKKYELEDEKGLYRLKKVEEMSALGMRGRHTMVFPIEGIMPRKGFQWKFGKDQVEKYRAKNDIEIVEGKVYFKIRPADETSEKFLPFWSHFFDKEIYGTSEKGKAELTKILESNKHEFETVKPINLIKKLLFHVNKKDCIVLDFFAGSGTTGHAVMELNEADEGQRQFILITNNDEITNGRKYKIMTDICYPRIKKAIKKHSSNSIRYFKTAFVGKNNILKADDADKIELAHNAGGMLAIAENTFDQVEQNSYWQIFESPKQYTAVYFREEFGKFDDFIVRVNKLKKPTVVYIFSWEKEFEFNEFEDDKNIKVKTIPQPILEIYKQIYNLV
jgi:adenine-specific DNA-methyltransferase